MVSPITRTDLIDQHVRHYLRETGTKRLSWAQDVADQYMHRTPLAHRTVQFHSGGDAEKDARANRQILDRMFDTDCDIRFPADLEEAVVYALPEHYRDRLLAELAGRYGLLAAAMPQPCEPGERSQDWCARAGRLLTEAGQSLEALAPVVADGAIDGDDWLEDLQQALREQRDVQALSTEIIAALQHAIAQRRSPEPALKVVEP